MKLKDEILINQYGQNLVEREMILTKFNPLDINEKEMYLDDLLNLIMQSKPYDSDIEKAIIASNLKSTCTPCVMLRKGVANYLLVKITKLPERELDKSVVLLLELFKIAYQRRFKEEKNNPNKWWYWDLSKEENLESILN